MKAYIEQNKERFYEELFTLLRIPSVSARPEHAEDMYRCAETLADLLLEAGADEAGVCETAGQFAYIYAIADSEHLAMSAPIISAYCMASVIWSRIFLKEKLSWKHYLMIALVIVGIVIMGVYDV